MTTVASLAAPARATAAGSFGALALAAGLALAAALALTVGLAGCGSQAQPEDEARVAAGAPVEIGYLASLSGFCAAAAREYVAGARLAVAEIDARGGVDGHRLALIVRDDRATPSVGVERARALVSEDHVKFLAGTCSSAVATSVARLVANPGHVVYAVGSTDPSTIAGGSEIYAFDTLPSTTVEGRAAAAYVRAIRGHVRRVGVVAEDDSYGRQVAAAFAGALRGGGARIVSEQFVPSGGRDYRPYIRRLLAARAQAVYAPVIEGDMLTLVRQGRPLGLFAGGGSVLAVMDYRTLARMARAPVGVQGYTYYPSASIYRTGLARELARLGRRVADGGAAGDAFNQIELLAQGIAKAGSTDPTAVRDALNGGASVRIVQGRVRVRACDHEVGAPIAMGPVAAPVARTSSVSSAAMRPARLEPVRLVGTAAYAGC